MENVEQLLGELIAQVRMMSERMEPGLPLVLNKRRAARELDISPSKLKGMIQRGQISTCRVGASTGIPRAELERLARIVTDPTRPGPLPPRRAGRKKPGSQSSAIRDLAKRKD
jgi:hypothetical protein